MLLTIDQSDDRPLYEQLAASVRRALVHGDLQPGDTLPPTREAAGALGVNVETVQRAYRQLAEEGLVVARVGRGTRIADDVDLTTQELDAAISQLLAVGQRLGMTRDELARRLRGT